MRLQGGYNVEAIATSALACVEVLLGDEPRAIKLGPASASACDTVQQVISVQSKHWKTMGITQASEPGLPPFYSFGSCSKVVLMCRCIS